MRHAAPLYDLGRGRTADGRTREAAARFGVDDALALEVGGHSTGMETRLALARWSCRSPSRPRRGGHHRGRGERCTGEVPVHSPAGTREMYRGKLLASLVPGYVTVVVGSGRTPSPST